MSFSKYLFSVLQKCLNSFHVFNQIFILFRCLDSFQGAVAGLVVANSQKSAAAKKKKKEKGKMNDPRKPRGRGKKCHEGTFCKQSEPAFEKLVLDANITLYTDPGYLAGANLNIVSIRQIIPAVRFNISLDLNPPAIRLDVFFSLLAASHPPQTHNDALIFLALNFSIYTH